MPRRTNPITIAVAMGLCIIAAAVFAKDAIGAIPMTKPHHGYLHEREAIKATEDYAKRELGDHGSTVGKCTRRGNGVLDCELNRNVNPPPGQGDWSQLLIRVRKHANGHISAIWLGSQN